MKFILWGILIISLVCCEYKLLFNPVSVELFDMQDGLIARAYRDDAFHADGRFLTAGCTPSPQHPHADPTVFECYADLAPEDEGAFTFVVTPPVPRGALPDVESAQFFLVNNKNKLYSSRLDGYTTTGSSN